MMDSQRVRDESTRRSKMLEEDGWYLDRTRGSHRQWKQARNPGLVTVPGKPAMTSVPVRSSAF
jgi:predicted RNA binding protein YcfA (HicA-like mRNA interferase family)